MQGAKKARWIGSALAVDGNIRPTMAGEGKACMVARGMCAVKLPGWRALGLQWMFYKLGIRRAP